MIPAPLPAPVGCTKPSAQLPMRTLTTVGSSQTRSRRASLTTSPVSFALATSAHEWPSAVGRQRSSHLDLDLNDDNAIYTSTMVLGKPGELWNSTRHQGHLYLPTLGVMVPMTVGVMVFFNASELPHLVIKLDDADKHKRTIVTTFTCAQMADALEHPPAFCLPWMRP
ncbi:hypothetical protein EHS25_004894 [Saitozyma podzolica]|uniref:Uncharacterized protein n=1 Tax=Saitozyma podzolica TaxID=1890683 RepID=A0A427Y2Z8_9TREE|nr:hypothetical protein EHS25_004894 [Saitozyma podzolica]